MIFKQKIKLKKITKKIINYINNNTTKALETLLSM